MRWAVALFLPWLATPAFGWQASFSGPVCLLTHETDAAEITLRHDPRQTLPYAIQIRRTDDAWQRAPQFIILFDGPGRLTIASDRYRLLEDDTLLEVADKGFGNVLAGLALNYVALAVLGEQMVVVPLAGAEAEVAEFRSCIVSPKL